MKDQVTKFDINAAFKALEDIEYPVVKGLKANKINLKETFSRKQNTEVLLEDYYDVNDADDLAVAKEDRSDEVAKAKLARIEKIVDLDAETEEDILPSYVGKFIIQCPQCMQLFYKDEADINKSEEDPETVNVGEQCPNCNNTQGFDLIGKVGEVGADEMSNYTGEDDALNLDFEEPAEEVPEDDLAVEEQPAEENNEEDLSLEEVPTEEEEKKEESFNRPTGESLNESKEIFDIYDGTGSHIEREANKKYISRDDELIELAKTNPDIEYHYHTNDDDFKTNVKEIPSNIKIVKESLNEKISTKYSDQLYSVYAKNDLKYPVFVGINKKECEDYVKKYENSAPIKARGGFVIKQGGTANVFVKESLRESEGFVNYADDDDMVFICTVNNPDAKDQGYNAPIIQAPRGNVQKVLELDWKATRDFDRGYADLHDPDVADGYLEYHIKNFGTDQFTADDDDFCGTYLLYDVYDIGSLDAGAVYAEDLNADPYEVLNKKYKYGDIIPVEDLKNSEIEWDFRALGPDFDIYNESLKESADSDLNAKLKAHDEYIKYLQAQIKSKEAALKSEKNDSIKQSIQKEIDGLNADLEAALPDALKGDIPVSNDLPDADEVPEEAIEGEEVKESLTEGKYDGNFLDDYKDTKKSGDDDDDDASDMAMGETTVADELEDYLIGSDRKYLKTASGNAQVRFGKYSGYDFYLDKNFNYVIRAVKESDLDAAKQIAQLFNKQYKVWQEKYDSKHPWRIMIPIEDSDWDIIKRSDLESTFNPNVQITAGSVRGTQDNIVHDNMENESLKEAIEVSKNDSIGLKAAWAAANFREFYRKAFANELDAEFKKLKKEAFNRVKTKFECNGNEANDILAKGASIYKRIYESLNEAKSKKFPDPEDIVDDEFYEEPRLSWYEITDGISESEKYDVLDTEALEDIVNFIEYSPHKDDIKLSWFWIEDDGEDGDLVVSIYGPDENYDVRTMSNWGYAEDIIIDALNGKKESSRQPKFSMYHESLKKESFVESCLREENELLPDEISDADIDNLFDSKEFNTPISDEEVEEIIDDSNVNEDFDIDEVEDIDEKSLDEHFSKYFTEVYSNVKNFKTTSCQAENSKVVIEGKINFKSGKSKSTKFNLSIKEGCKNKAVVLRGYNANKSGKFIVEAVNKKSGLKVNNIKYRCQVNEDLVEGYTRKK